MFLEVDFFACDSPGQCCNLMSSSQVTLVYNVHIYGIDEAEFAHQIQVGVAASTSVGPAEHKPQGTTQVLVQGNQVAFIGKLLLGEARLVD